MQKILLIALAGSLGALARYGTGALVTRMLGSGFVWGTVAANLLGCFLFGVVWSLAEERTLISEPTRVALLVGFMGSYTTFSTFVFETNVLLRDGAWVPALLNIFMQSVAGLGLMIAGLALGRAL